MNVNKAIRAAAKKAVDPQVLLFGWCVNQSKKICADSILKCTADCFKINNPQTWRRYLNDKNQIVLKTKEQIVRDSSTFSFHAQDKTEAKA